MTPAEILRRLDNEATETASDFTISGSCPFDVRAHVVTNNEYGITFANGATLVTGVLKVNFESKQSE